MSKRSVSVLQPVITTSKRVVYDNYGMFSRRPLQFSDSAYSLKRDRKTNQIWIAGNGLVYSLLNDDNGMLGKSCII